MSLIDYRTVYLPSTTDPVAWSIDLGVDTDIQRLTIKFATAPSTSENVTVKVDFNAGSEYEAIIRSAPNSDGDISFEDILGIDEADAILVEYANTDGVSVAGTCTIRRGDQ
jgi:hypothetical protein